ncbi:MAG TPA: NADH:flavin oxidoreductase/NADH oxidase [Thermoanaerobaculaceae bacterium]|nr:NADH:flavin oxidoreductase/NADH oxidase [Thermoanaerobaculaceae bacterium]
MSVLFSTLRLREVTFRNRVFVSPMCQYSCEQGMPNDWHFVHLGSRAVGGAALVFTEATSVSAEGRISPADAGIWSDTHVAGWARVTTFVAERGAVPGIQLAHAGRKASTGVPWEGGGGLAPDAGGWQPLAPSAVRFDDGSPEPRELTGAEIGDAVSGFAAAARRALAAGFRVVELHMAHGYLCHQFLSPLSNRRTDRYGGSLENRMRFPLEVAGAVRAAWPAELPLFVRVSATDWAEGGWTVEESVEFARRLKGAGVDLVDCSSGGLVPHARVPVGPGYQTPFAARIRAEAGIPTGAVGMITEPAQAEQIVATGQADAVLLARQLLREPYWPLRAARELGADGAWPSQYLRAKPR